MATRNPVILDKAEDWTEVLEQEVNYEREANGLQEAKDLIRSRVSDVKSLLSSS